MINKRCAFGNRNLKDNDDVFAENAWDNVVWTPDIEKEISQKIENNSAIKVSDEQRHKHINEAGSFWNEFYQKHDNKFFKDRHWLTTEYPELVNSNLEHPINIFEVGCGVGNSIFPLIKENRKNKVFLYGCDLSSHAIDILKTHELYDEANSCYGFVADITDNEQSFPFEENSLDAITLIFVLSAITPSKLQAVIDKLARYLKSGGYFLFRDYGRYDLAQMRFKQGQCLDDNFYARRDGTMVYFFTEEEIEQLFLGVKGCKITKVHIYTDRRLLVNRAKQSKMYRVWLTGKFQKL